MEKLNSGMSLSDVQKLLDSEFGIRMTYFELRMIASTLKIDWDSQAKKHRPAANLAQQDGLAATAQAARPPEGPADRGTMDDGLDDEEDLAEENDGEGLKDDLDGGTSITLDETPVPGAAMSGKVRFASGASGKWVMTRMGQLGISDMDEGSPEPTQDDIALFQQELRLTMQARQEALEQQAFDGRTKVEISPLVKPGCDMNGTVVFASGAKGEWLLAGGKLDFDLEQGSPEPTRDDKLLFQMVLARKLKEKGFA